MRESDFQSKLSASLRGAGAMVFNVHGHEMQAAGWPDLQVYSPRWVGQLELKMAAGRLSPMQRRVVGELRRRGFPAWVLRVDCRLEDHLGELHGHVDWRADAWTVLEELDGYSKRAGLLSLSHCPTVPSPHVRRDPSR
jgi:hypothetical protein